MVEVTPDPGDITAELEALEEWRRLRGGRSGAGGLCVLRPGFYFLLEISAKWQQNC